MSHLLAVTIAAPAIAAAVLLMVPQSSRLALRVVSLIGAIVALLASIQIAFTYEIGRAHV
jgi:formate hydrogenlyase subunit 3/multisubunit Na+/H+ antiporter MnhD subunit